MRKVFLAVICSLFTLVAFSQKIKTGVVVFGNSPAALAAAIQSAHSGVKTVLTDKGSFDVINLAPADKAYKIGLYAQFLERVDSLQKNSAVKNNGSLVPSYVGTIFKGWTDTIKNLTVLKRLSLKEIKRDGKSWEMSFNNRTEIKADVVIDATSGNLVANMAKVSVADYKPEEEVYSDKLYRTSLALADQEGGGSSAVPAKALIGGGKENFFTIGSKVPNTILVGQGMGAAAAFCAFFNTTTDKLDLRKTQAELIAFHSQFIKLDDISLSDSNAVAIQKVVLTGILKGKRVNNKFLFLPDSSVSTEEIKMPVREYYSRSQIWFLDHKSDKLTLEQAISLIKFTAGRGNELDKEVEKGWNTSLKLKGKFDPKAVISKYQLAVLFANYLKPFERSIDLDGNLKI